MSFIQLAPSIALGLWLTPLYADSSKPPAIMGPDGPRGVRPQKAPAAQGPTLRQWLKQRRQEREDQETPADAPGSPAAAAPGSQELPASREKLPPPPLSKAFLRWNIGLVLPKIWSAPSAAYSAEPGTLLGVYGRLTQPLAPAASLWLGMRMLAFSGAGRIQQQAGRFAWIYVGPAVAWEWLNYPEVLADGEHGEPTSRQRLGVGLALISRQGEKQIGDMPTDLSTRSAGVDLPGLWLEYSYAASFSTQCDWEFTSGLQLGQKKITGYLSLGFSLWLADRV